MTSVQSFLQPVGQCLPPAHQVTQSDCLLGMGHRKGLQDRDLFSDQLCRRDRLCVLDATGLVGGECVPAQDNAVCGRSVCCHFPNINVAALAVNQRSAA